MLTCFGLPLLAHFLRDVRQGAGSSPDRENSVLASLALRLRQDVCLLTDGELYRESYNLHASNGILFNHESPRRVETFITREITRAVGRIKHILQTKLKLGDLSPKCDWGYAPEYVEGMWRMLQADNPDDYVIATNESHSVQEFVKEAFEQVGWIGYSMSNTTKDSCERWNLMKSAAVLKKYGCSSDGSLK